jgi:hypothetical protein
MPTQIFETKSKDRITKVLLSDDWKSKTPWRHKNVDQPYFAKISELSESGDVQFLYLYVGPFGVISGKCIGEDV